MTEIPRRAIPTIAILYLTIPPLHHHLGQHHLTIPTALLQLTLYIHTIHPSHAFHFTIHPPHSPKLHLSTLPPPTPQTRRSLSSYPADLHLPALSPAHNERASRNPTNDVTRPGVPARDSFARYVGIYNVGTMQMLQNAAPRVAPRVSHATRLLQQQTPNQVPTHAREITSAQPQLPAYLCDPRTRVAPSQHDSKRRNRESQTKRIPKAPRYEVPTPRTPPQIARSPCDRRCRAIDGRPRGEAEA